MNSEKRSATTDSDPPAAICHVSSYAFYVPLRGILPQASEPIRLEASRCVFDCASVLKFEQSRAFLDKAAMLEPGEAEDMLRRSVLWQGEGNVFASGSTSVRWTAALVPQPAHGPKCLEQWQRFWEGEENDSLEGQVRFHGGSLRSRLAADLDQLTPDDFRLRPDSAGVSRRPRWQGPRRGRSPGWSGSGLRALEENSGVSGVA